MKSWVVHNVIYPHRTRTKNSYITKQNRRVVSFSFQNLKITVLYYKCHSSAVLSGESKSESAKQNFFYSYDIRRKGYFYGKKINNEKKIKNGLIIFGRTVQKNASPRPRRRRQRPSAPVPSAPRFRGQINFKCPPKISFILDTFFLFSFFSPATLPFSLDRCGARRGREFN